MGAGQQYFRKETRSSETTEIFTDVESKIARYKRELAFLGFFYFILMMLIIPTGRLLSDDSYPWWGNIPQIIIIVVLLLFTYAIIRLIIRMRQLRKL
jgi:hypothetical protein